MKTMITANRYHDICCGHRVYGHESKCAHLHGHNYRFHFSVRPLYGLDDVGRVIDFSVIKSILCNWLEEMWDHKMLIWREDPLYKSLKEVDPTGVVGVYFNPTAENIAEHFVEVIAPSLFEELPVELVSLTLEETRKCSVTYDKRSS
jgi:6-pyruvoyltetrahydropterin/6-carboxytetrahydropterin synthase